MDNDDSNKSDDDRPRIKVTDRRKFAPDGTPRPDAAEQTTTEAAPDKTASSEAAEEPTEEPTAEPTTAPVAESAAALDDPSPEPPDRQAERVSARPPSAETTETPVGSSEDAGETPVGSNEDADEALDEIPEGAEPDEAASSDLDPTMAAGISRLPRDFGAFVESMYLEAMLYMGAIADPRTGETIEDTELAKYKIDLLIMLREKTEGNLTPDEERQLEEVLYQLRMLYLQKTKTARL